MNERSNIESGRESNTKHGVVAIVSLSGIRTHANSIENLDWNITMFFESRLKK